MRAVLYTKVDLKIAISGSKNLLSDLGYKSYITMFALYT